MPAITISSNTGATYSGVLDTGLSEEQPSSNFASAVDPGLGNNLEVTSRRVFYAEFTIPNLGAVDVSTARLRLTTEWGYFFAGSGSRTSRLFPCLRAPVVTEMTFNVFSTGNNWETAGAAGVLDRGAQIASALIPASASALTTFDYAGAGLNTALEALLNGGGTFRGLVEDDTNIVGIWFVASSETTDGIRPILEITYEIAGGGGPTPEVRTSETEVSDRFDALVQRIRAVVAQDAILVYDDGGAVSEASVDLTDAFATSDGLTARVRRTRVQDEFLTVVSDRIVSGIDSSILYTEVRTDALGLSDVTGKALLIARSSHVSVVDLSQAIKSVLRTESDFADLTEEPVLIRYTIKSQDDGAILVDDRVALIVGVASSFKRVVMKLGVEGYT